MSLKAELRAKRKYGRIIRPVRRARTCVANSGFGNIIIEHKTQALSNIPVDAQGNNFHLAFRGSRATGVGIQALRRVLGKVIPRREFERSPFSGRLRFA